MPTRALKRQLDSIESDVPSDGGSQPGLDRIEIRDPAPDSRPSGMAYDSDSGTLRYDFWEPQHEFLAALDSGDYQIVAFLAGYGSGKSIGGTRWLLIQALRHPGSRFLAMGQSFSEARDATYQVLFNQLPGERTSTITSSYNGPETSPIVSDYNRAEHRITLTNDSVIVLGSADKWSRHAGSEFGAIWLDEPSHYSDLHDLLEMMGSRLRGVPGPKVQAWTLTGAGYNDSWELLEKRQDSNGEPLSLNIKVVRASTLDNPYLSDGEKEQFALQYGGTSREEQALHGGFAAAQGLVYSQFSRDTHVIPHTDAVSRIEDDWRILGYDAGWNDPRVLLELGRTPYNQFVVVDEFYQHESHVDAAIEWLTSENKPKGTIYCEHVPGELEKFREAGWPAEKADKNLDSGIAEVRARLEIEAGDARDRPGGSSGNAQQQAGSPTLPSRLERQYRSSRDTRRVYSASTSQHEAEQPTGDSSGAAEPAPGLLISDRCEHLIRELLGYKEEHVGKSTAEDHCVDSLRYAVHTSSTGGSGSQKRSRMIRTDPW